MTDLKKPFKTMYADIRSIDKKQLLFVQILVIALTAMTLPFLQIPSGITALYLISGVVLAWNYWRFVLALFPFMALLTVYTNLRNVANLVTNQPIHVQELIHMEQTLFGEKIPSVWLQESVMGRVIEPYVNVAAGLVYVSFFWIPVVVAFLLWIKSKRDYWIFVSGLLLLSFGGYACYLLYPAAPPWWANHFGYLTGAAALPNPGLLDAKFLLQMPNPVAAMPSLHAAYPTYIAGMSLLFWGRRARFMILLPILISLSAVYLGHHYVVDILAGVMFGLLWVGLGKASYNWSLAKSVLKNN